MMRVVLTGAATGIGAATVARLKAEGAEITAFDIAEPERVDRWVRVDMSDMAAIRAAVDTLDSGYDVLINNAGLPPRDGNAAEVLAVNVLGLREMTRAMLPRLSDGARIVNTASRAGMAWRDNIDEVRAMLAITDPADLPDFIAARGIDALRAYNLSKEAVIAYSTGMTRSLLSRNMRVNTVSPAPIATRILDDFMTAIGERAKFAMDLTGRAGTPDEVARVIVFLASEASHWVRGADIRVDGGVSAVAEADALGLDFES